MYLRRSKARKKVQTKAVFFHKYVISMNYKEKHDLLTPFKSKFKSSYFDPFVTSK